MSDREDKHERRNGELEHIERLLEEYRVTKDRRLLEQAIGLWNQTTAEAVSRRSVVRVH